MTWDDDAVKDMIVRVGRTYLVDRLRTGKRLGLKVRIGAVDPSLTGVSGMAAVTELCEQFDVVGALDGVVGPIKRRAGGQSAGQLLVGLAAAQSAGQDHLGDWTATARMRPVRR